MNKRITTVFGIGVVLLAIVGGWWYSHSDPARRNRLRIVFLGKPTQVDRYNRRPYTPNMVAFNLIGSNNSSIAVWETGTQWLTENGWETVHEERRDESWNLTSGNAIQFTVEPPSDGKWRAFIDYGTEMKGLPLLKAQLREAWKIRSLSNWTGKAWGGGRWSGSTKIFSEPVGQ